VVPLKFLPPLELEQTLADLAQVVPVLESTLELAAQAMQDLALTPAWGAREVQALESVLA
jgi:hypothetical protein